MGKVSREKRPAISIDNLDALGQIVGVPRAAKKAPAARDEFALRLVTLATPGAMANPMFEDWDGGFASAKS
jgi:hypothetical protein